MTYPFQQIYGGQLRSPLLMNVASNAAAFAGRTTLASGSATVVVSTNVVGSDSLIDTHIQAALAAEFVTQGRISVASGFATGTFSTTAINSGDVVALSWEGATNTLSGQSRGFRANSIVEGVSFAVATEDGQITTAGAASVMFKIHGKDAQGIKVNTISPGGHFILGWADGVARPFNTTLMWQVHKGS